MSKRKIKKKVKVIIDGVHNPKLSDLEREIVEAIKEQAPEIYKKEREK